MRPEATSSKLDNLEQIAERFVRFADETHGLSPLYATLSPAIAGDRELLELLLVASPMQRRANLLFAAVHNLLLSGVSHGVARYYPSIHDPAMPPDQEAFETFRDFCLSHRMVLRETMAVRRTQTNEVRRSVAFLPVIQQLSAAEPIAVVEVGASAGLNLLLDRFRYRYGEGRWVGASGSPVAVQCDVRGAMPPVQSESPQIAFRVGLDSHPLDVSNEDDACWLMACVWPEHTERLQLLRAALELARENPPRIVKGNAPEDLEAVIDEVPDDLPICLFHSALMPYLTSAERTAFVSTIDRIGRRRQLHWLSLEGAEVRILAAQFPFGHLYTPRPADRPKDILGLLGYAWWNQDACQERLLARVEMHGRWIEWLGEARKPRS